MARGRAKQRRRLLPGAVESGLRRLMLGSYGLLVVTVACAAWASLATWSVHDPSLNNATRAAPRNLLGGWGAVVADLTMQSLGLAAIILFLPLAAWGWHLFFHTTPNRRRLRLLAWPASVILLAAAITTVLAGIWLLWLTTDGLRLDLAFDLSRLGYTIGGIAACSFFVLSYTRLTCWDSGRKGIEPCRSIRRCCSQSPRSSPRSPR